MERKIIEYERKSIAASCFVDLREANGIVVENCNKMLRLAIEASLYEREVKTKDIVHEFPAPTFREWLFRKKRKVVLHADVKEVLKPPFPADLKDRILLTEFQLIPLCERWKGIWVGEKARKDDH